MTSRRLFYKRATGLNAKGNTMTSNGPAILFCALLIFPACAQKTNYTNAEIASAQTVCKQKFPDASGARRENLEYDECIAKNVGMSRENLLKAADRNDNIRVAYFNARTKCGRHLNIDPNTTRGLEPQFDACVNRVVGVPSLQDLQALAAISSARRAPVYNQNVYINQQPHGSPTTYADPFGSFLRGARGY